MRPTDWAPLADRDPVPGDPDAVAELARRYARMAETIREQAATLRAIGEMNEEIWDSDSGRVFAETARVTVGKLDQVFERYAAAAKALTGYHPVLREAQTESLAARSLALDAHARLEKAQWNATTLDGDVAPSLVHTVIPDTGRPAADDLAHARRKLSYAVDSVDRAARAAAAQIDSVVAHDHLKDSGWQHFKAWVHDQEWIARVTKVCGDIAAAAGAAALVLACIPGLQPLAGVLEALALAGTLVTFLPHMFLAVTGNGSWVDVGVDVVSVSTFGLGRATLALTRETTTGIRAGIQLARAQRFVSITPRITGLTSEATFTARGVRQAWRVAGRGFGDDPLAANKAFQAMPRRILPNLRQIKAAMNPRELWAELRESAAKIRHPGDMAEELKFAWQEASNLPRDLERELAEIRSAASEYYPKGMRTVSRAQRGLYVFWSGSGITLETLNNGGYLEPLK